jgi:microcystin-dependent protein
VWCIKKGRRKQMAEQISSLDKPITLADWHEIYQRLLPYLGGNKAVDGNPIGTVITFPISTPPAGYLVCDGSKLSVTAFPLLFDVLKNAPASQRAEWGDADWVTEFNVPDYRGEFPRFYGTNSHTNQGNGGAVGEHQDGTSLPRFYLETNGKYSSTFVSGEYNVPNNTDYDKAGTNISIAQVNTSNIISPGTNRTLNSTVKPTNTSFLPCIKYTYVTQEVEYSPEERVVGVWKEAVDGVLKQKPLYQKTLSNSYGTISSSITSLNVGQITSDNSIDDVIDMNVTATYGGSTVTLPYFDAASPVSTFTNYYYYNNHIGSRSNNTNASNALIRATVRYTKTTDQWQTS